VLYVQHVSLHVCCCCNTKIHVLHKVYTQASAVQVVNEEVDGTNNGGEDNEEGSAAPSDKQLDDTAAAAVEQPSGPVDELDLRAYVPATGGLIMLELLHLPPQPKCVNGWTMRQGQFSTQLHYHLYNYKRKDLDQNHFIIMNPF